jgi:hypothetical protein
LYHYDSTEFIFILWRESASLSFNSFAVDDPYSGLLVTKNICIWVTLVMQN